MSDAIPLLFEDLPEQHPPAILYADEHILERCARCKGTGREENPYPPSHRSHAEWDPVCRGCAGHGGRVLHIGAVRDIRG